jgi:hypothetical protein
MALVLTAFRDTQERRHPATVINEYRATSSTEYFSGGLIAMDVATDRLVKASGLAGTGAGTVVLGRCEEDRITGAATTKYLKVKCGIFKWLTSDTITSGDIGRTMFVVSDEEVNLADPGTSAVAGQVYDVGEETGTVWVTTLFPAAAQVV